MLKSGKSKPRETATTLSGTKRLWQRVLAEVVGAAAGAITATAQPGPLVLVQLLVQLVVVVVQLLLETFLVRLRAHQAVRGALEVRDHRVLASQLVAVAVAAVLAATRRTTSAARLRARCPAVVWGLLRRGPLKVCRLKSTNLRCLRLRRRCLRAYEAASF